jgi:hypothetical protein
LYLFPRTVGPISLDVVVTTTGSDGFVIEPWDVKSKDVETVLAELDANVA